MHSDINESAQRSFPLDLNMTLFLIHCVQVAGAATTKRRVTPDIKLSPVS